MKIALATAALMTFFLNIGAAHAWVDLNDASIVEFIQFNEGISRDYSILKLEDTSGSQLLCYVPYGEKNLTSLALSMYMSGKKGWYHCYDDVLDIGGFKAHRLHRLIAK